MVRAQKRHIENIRLPFLRTDEDRAVRIEGFACGQVKLLELVIEVASNLQAVFRGIDLGCEKGMPAFAAPGRRTARSHTCDAAACRTQWLPAVVGAGVFRPWPSKFVEEDTAVIGRAVEIDGRAADRAVSVRVNVALDCSPTVLDPSTGDRPLQDLGHAEMPMLSATPTASASVAAKAAVAIKWMIIGVAHRASFQGSEHAHPATELQDEWFLRNPQDGRHILVVI
jgi:hypothetical protein